MNPLLAARARMEVSLAFHRVFAAIGAVSGTALSFDLGLLWPRFTRLALLLPALGWLFRVFESAR
jgi:cytochrome bd-type quinol oxidase subunit 1